MEGFMPSYSLCYGKHTHFKTIKKSQGFTLLELMIVIAIMAILATIATPNFSNLIRSTSVETVTDDLYSALLYTRSEATTQIQDIVIIPQGTWGEGWDIFIDSDSNGSQSTDERTLKSYVNNTKTVSIIGYGGVQNSVRYSPSGRSKGVFTTASKDYFKIKNNNKELCLKLTLTGLPYINTDTSKGC
jgi:type IV fimbrial biogenesis protein FimT